MKNRKTITYTITEDGFKYHITKGILKKGSIVSKKVHPIEMVNEYREKLLKNKTLINKGEFYELTKSIRIGALMAYNLHMGHLVNEFAPGNEIVINHRDTKIIDEFKMNNIYLTNSELRINECRDATKLIGIYDIKVDFKPLSNQDPDEFSEIEKIFYDILIDQGIIDKNSYHGSSNKHECDIVDEFNNHQIELVTEFKNRIKGDKTPHRNVEIFLLEAINNNFIHTSKALLDKFTSKDYTDKYEKSIGIFCFGSQDSIGTMLKVLDENIKKTNIKNNYKEIYLLWYDIAYEKYYFYSDKTGVVNVDNVQLQMVTKNLINFAEMEEDKGYLIVLENIFKKQTILSYMLKNDLREYLKELNVPVNEEI